MKILKLFNKKEEKAPRYMGPKIENTSWKTDMNGIKRILKNHMPFSEHLDFCRGFLKEKWVHTSNDNWDSVAPTVQGMWPEFMAYCKKNLETWE